MLSRLLSILPLLFAFVLPVQAGNPDYRIQTLAEGLSHPWSMAFLPDGRLLVTERDGRLRLVEDGRLHPEAIAGVPEAYVASQGGLFDILPHPDWDNNGWLYLSLAHGDRSASTTRLVRGRLDRHRLVDVEVLFDAEPARDTPVHYGGRMAWLPDGTLVLGLGDGFEYREEAQKPANHLGTLVRLADDGGIPPDNPLSEGNAARPEVFSYGHRNIQGLVYDPDTDSLWATEHGPRGGDELNIIRPGANYGWPAASHGVDYSGGHPPQIAAGHGVPGADLDTVHRPRRPDAVPGGTVSGMAGGPVYPRPGGAGNNTPGDGRQPCYGRKPSLYGDRGAPAGYTHRPGRGHLYTHGQRAGKTAEGFQDRTLKRLGKKAAVIDDTV